MLVFCVPEANWVFEKGRVTSLGIVNFRVQVDIAIVMEKAWLSIKKLLRDVVEVSRKGDRILLTLMLNREIFKPQVGLDKSNKRQIWENADWIIQWYPLENLYSGNFNKYVGTTYNGFNSVHGGSDFRERNELGSPI